MKFRVFTIAIILIFLFLSCDRKERHPTLSIIPRPVQLEIEGGEFLFDSNTELVLDSVLLSATQTYQDLLTLVLGFTPQVGDKNSTKKLELSMEGMPASQYEINSTVDRITIRGGSSTAVMNGLQSLRQLILLNEENQIPLVHILDSPRFQWRGLLLDCSRHFMEKEFVKRYVDLLSFYKMNVLHWHLTEDQGWRVEVDKYPLLTEVGAWRSTHQGRYGGFYSKEDIREIVEYAENRGVMVVPEIELPGHAQAALAAYPKYSCTGGPFEVETEWGVFKEIYCAGNDSTFIFLEDVLTEVIDLFPSPFIHIGGDEVPKFRWEHCSKCQRRMQEEGLEDEHELQSYFISRIGDFLSSKGKTLIGWDEILEGGLPDGAIVQSWRGFEGAKEAVHLGSQAIVSPTSHAYFDYGLNDIDLEKVYSFEPIPVGLLPSEEALILGGECNMWSERAPQSKVDSKVFPRILAMAEILWSQSETKDFEEFRDNVADHYPVLDDLGVQYGFETTPVKIETNVIGDSLMIHLAAYDSNFQIFYSDGDITRIYEGPVYQENEALLSITFGSGNTIFPDTIFQAFKPHLANGLTPGISESFNESYSAGGELGLTDGLKGSSQFRDGNWQGYWGVDFEVVVDLKETMTVSEFSSGFLQYNNAWIFFPSEVSYAISNDGITYQPAGTVMNKHSPRDKEQMTQEFNLALDQKVETRYIKLKTKSMKKCPAWHDAAGSKAWLFIDEFSVN